MNAVRALLYRMEQGLSRGGLQHKFLSLERANGQELCSVSMKVDGK